MILETGSHAAITLLRKDGASLGPYALLVEKCKELSGRAWRVTLCHICREGNKVADWIANWVVHLQVGVHVLESPPAGVIILLQADIRGIS